MLRVDNVLNKSLLAQSKRVKMSMSTGLTGVQLPFILIQMVVVILALVPIVASGDLNSRTVKTKYGDLKGVIIKLERNLGGVEVFRGIPYASPPVGSLRFMPPVNGAPWHGVKVADKFGPVCPQKLPELTNAMPPGRMEYLRRLLPLLRNQSEDCLYLNIYAPAQENYAMLQKIKENLDGNEKNVHLGCLEYTNNDLLYSEILKSTEKHQDGTKLYFDPSILPLPSELSPGRYVFSLQVNDNSGFFDTQPSFIEANINEHWDVKNDVSVHNSSVNDLCTDVATLDVDPINVSDIPIGHVLGHADTTYTLELPTFDEHDSLRTPVNGHETSKSNVPSFFDDTVFKDLLTNEINTENASCVFEQAFTMIDVTADSIERDTSTPQQVDGLHYEDNRQGHIAKLVRQGNDGVKIATERLAIQNRDDNDSSNEKSLSNLQPQEDKSPQTFVSRQDSISTCDTDVDSQKSSKVLEKPTIVNALNDNSDNKDTLGEESLSEIQPQEKTSPQELVGRQGLIPACQTKVDLPKPLSKVPGKPEIISDEVLVQPILMYKSTNADRAPSSSSVTGSNANHTSGSPSIDPIECLKTSRQVDDSLSRSTSLGILDSMVAGNIFYFGVNASDDVDLSNRVLTPPAVSSTVLDCAVGANTFNTAQETDEIETSNDQNRSEGDEYMPLPTESSEYTGSISEGPQETPNDKKKKSDRNSRDESKMNASFNVTLGLNRPGLSAPDDTVLTVPTSETTSSTKKHFCMYCHKFQMKIARHLANVHGDEDDVKKFTLLPPKNHERLEIIATIRKNGNHIYNTDRRFNTGKLLVCRNPNKKMKKTAKDFMPCPKCKGQYTKALYRHHVKKCVKFNGKKERIFMVKGRKIAARIHEKASEDVRTNIFPYMREDNVVRSIRYDELVIIYANRQCEKYSTHQHQYQMIRGRLRLLGRFLVEIKKLNNSIQDFSDVFQPRNYDDCIVAIKSIANFDPHTRTYAHPTNASNLGTYLKAMGELLRSVYIRRENEHEQKRVEDFLKLQSEDFGITVNRAVAETQAQNNRRKKVELPSIDDITKLHNFLKTEREKYFNDLQSEFSFNSWKKLAEVTLISLQLFNRRRPGEIERLYVEDFNGYRGIDKDADKEIYDALSKEAKILAQKYVRFEIRGKLGRGVPVLVSSDLFDSLMLIKKHRADAGVPEYNHYLFGLPSKDKDRCRYLRACDLLREYSTKCGAAMSNRLRGTKLRKHIATRCIRLNLSENQVKDLANYLGHHEKIHKEIYRQPILETDIIKMSKLLEFVQGPVESSDEEESEDEESIQNEKSSKKRKLNIDEQNGSADEPKDIEKPGSSTSISQFKKIPQKKSTRELSIREERVTHRRWTDEECSTVLGAFKTKLIDGKMPTGDAMQKLINENDCLKGRQVPQVRTWLHGKKKKMINDDDA